MGSPDLTNVVATGLAESRGQWWIRIDNDKNGFWDWGTWQINDKHKAILESGNPYDLWDNAKMAWQVFVEAGYRLDPWVAFTNKAFEEFLPRALVVTK